jgi:hypothetical protein
MRLRGQLSALEYLAARRYAAAADRQAVTAPILHQTGEDGLAIVDAIVAGCSLSDIAGGVRERASYGWLLRRSLGALAMGGRYTRAVIAGSISNTDSIVTPARR